DHPIDVAGARIDHGQAAVAVRDNHRRPRGTGDGQRRDDNQNAAQAGCKVPAKSRALQAGHDRSVTRCTGLRTNGGPSPSVLFTPARGGPPGVAGDSSKGSRSTESPGGAGALELLGCLVLVYQVTIAISTTQWARPDSAPRFRVPLHTVFAESPGARSK